VDLVKRLDLISVKMETQRPKTSLLQRGDPIPQDKVLKRSHSDCGSHVLFPNLTCEIGWDFLEEGLPGSLWMAQEFVPHLCDLGEWRFVLWEGPSSTWSVRGITLKRAFGPPALLTGTTLLMRLGEFSEPFQLFTGSTLHPLFQPSRVD
jgi:hypothetical protein